MFASTSFIQPEVFKDAFASLNNAIDAKLHHVVQRKIQHLLNVKETLRMEVQSVKQQRDMFQQELITLSDRHSSLNAAYHSLSDEIANQFKTETEQWKMMVEEQKQSIRQLTSK